MLPLRLLRRRSGFTLVSVLTLALGIGAPTAVFSVIRAVLLRPLPYADADRLVRFRIESQTPAGAFAFDALPASEALAWGTASATLSSIAMFNDRAMTILTPGGPFRLSGAAVTPNLFATLGTPAWRGRTIAADDTEARQIVLSHSTWQRFFNGDAAIISTTISMDGAPYRVTGVMPAEFAFPTAETAFWVPLTLTTAGTRGMLLPAIARLRPESTVAAALQEGRDLLGTTNDSRVRQTLLARSLADQLVGPVRGALWLLLGAVGIVVVIATVNIALLLLTRGAAREREMAVRLALGASRGRLVRQLLIEGLALGALGGLTGVGLAWMASRFLLALAPPDIPRLNDVTLDGAVLLFALGLTMVTSLAFSLLSAGRTVAVDVIRGVTQTGGEPRLAGVHGPSRRRLMTLAAAEIAKTMMLLAGAGLLLRSVVARLVVDQGFDARGAVAMQISLPPPAYPTPEARTGFHRQLLAALQHHSGVESAGLAASMPNRQPTGRFDFSATPIVGPPEPFSDAVAEVRMVTEGFAEAMGLRLLAGRTFTSHDVDGAEPVIVISERLARQHFGEADAIGRVLYSRTGDRRVVGVVGDVLPLTPGAEPQAAAYLPLWQNTDVLAWLSGMHVVIRGSDAAALAPSLRATVLSLDSAVPPYNVRRLDADVARVVAGPRFTAWLLVVFAGGALAMSAIALYSVMAYAARLRTREIGIRLALGSTRREAMQTLVREALVATGAGVVAGLLLSIALSTSLASVVADLPSLDPLTLVALAVSLTAVAAAAALLPARRAAWRSPVEALRCD